MADDPRCEALRDSLVELALGIASGDERAEVVAHAGRCASCQRLLNELALVGDELLHLVPEHEPPPGFELRVLERIGAPRAARRRRRRLGRFALALAAVLAAAGLAAGAALYDTRDERRLGEQLAAVLARAEGKYIAVTELRDARRRNVGLVFHYGGNPSWVFVTLDRPLPAGSYRAELVTRAGAAHTMGTFTLDEDDRSLGSATRIDLLQVAELRLHGAGATYIADF
jgi:hypothetical protein